MAVIITQWYYIAMVYAYIHYEIIYMYTPPQSIDALDEKESARPSPRVKSSPI